MTGLFHSLKYSNFFLNLGRTYIESETAQEIRTVWENVGSVIRPLTVALFSKKQLYFLKTHDIVLQKDLELLLGVRIKSQQVIAVG